MNRQVCIVNIGPTQRRRRAWSGAIGLALGGAALGLATSISAPARHLLAVAALAVIYGGFLGIFQARGKT